MPDIQSLVEQMTLEEKAALCTGASAWTTVPVERLDLPELLVSDGPHGIRRLADIHTIAAQGHGDAGMNMLDFMMDLPLLSILHFQESLLPDAPEKMVADLLGQLPRS